MPEEPNEEFTDPFSEHPLKKPHRDMRNFRYHDLYKVRNMLCTFEIPVFTALPQDAAQETHKLQNVVCFN